MQPATFNDRAVLEMAEARIMRMSYYHNVKKLGQQKAAMWLAKRLQHLEAQLYEKGAEARIRGHMRHIEDNE
jgi:hypothetical protein